MAIRQNAVKQSEKSNVAFAETNVIVEVLKKFELGTLPF